MHGPIKCRRPPTAFSQLALPPRLSEKPKTGKRSPGRPKTAAAANIPRARSRGRLRAVWGEPLKDAHWHTQSSQPAPAARHYK
jgi:hypothetical protein